MVGSHLLVPLALQQHAIAQLVVPAMDNIDRTFGMAGYEASNVQPVRYLHTARCAWLSLAQCHYRYSDVTEGG